MKITELSVRRPVTGVMVFLCLAILGGYTFTRLRLDMLPNIEFPIVAVITEYPGASPESVEQLVTRPIEAALSSVKNVEDINSTSSQGASVVLVKFTWGTAMQPAEQEVRKNLEIFAADYMPEDAKRSLTFAFDPSMQPTVFLTVNTPGSAENARKIAEDVVEPYLTRIPGVASAQVLGGAKREIQVLLRPEWLEAYRISVPQVLAALRGSSVIMPGGSVTQGQQELNIATRAEFTSVEQIAEVVVGVNGLVPVRLRDVADVIDGYQELNSVVRADGQSAVMMMVRRQSDANTVQVAHRVLEELDRLEKMLPEGTQLNAMFDQAAPITRSISNLSSSALLAIVFTAAVLLAFLRNWRTSSIVLVSIPLSLLATFAIMDWRGVTMNIISMAGLALAVGMLVDNSIVVLENIFTHLQRGEDPKTAAIEGTNEMAMPISASTLTTIVVFAPILFVPGLAGQMFRDMSLTICFSLLASLLVALTLVPLLASLMVKRTRSRLEWLLKPLTGWLDPLGDLYGRALRVLLRHRGKLYVGTTVFFVGTVVIAAGIGMDFMAHNDQGYVELSVKGAPGTSLEQTDGQFRLVEEIVRAEVPEAEAITAQFGSGDGWSALFGDSSSAGSIQMRLPPRGQRERSQAQIEDALRKRLASLPGLEVRPSNGEAMLFGGAGDIVVKVFGDDLDAVRDYGKRLASRLATVPGAADVAFSMEQGVPELSVEVDRDQLKLLGLATAEVAATISTYFLGTTATVYREGGDEYRVFVRAPREVRADVERLRALPLVSPLGVTVPLDRVATIDPSLGPTSITRENQRRLATISITKNEVALDELVERTEAAIAEIGPAPGITTAVGGTAEDLKESFGALGYAFLIAVILVYMVMASQFESLLEPFVILFSVPLALSGVVLALVLTDTTVQVTVLIGVVLLAGIVVNNGIVLIDVLKKRRYAGEDLVEAAVLAGRSRLRPILMTALTTVFGMVPLAIGAGDGAELWTPMARAVIGGMTVSTILTLVVMPSLYVSLAARVDRRRARRAARRQAAEQTAAA